MIKPFQTLLQLCSCLLGVALIMAAWSEFVFYNEDPAAKLLSALERGGRAALANIAEMAVFYVIPSSFLLGLVALAGSHGSARILLLGALTGFAIEGAMVPAIYEAVPFSFLWTSVAWHGPVTVALGVFWLPHLFARASLPVAACAMVALGGLWGLWTTWTWGGAGFTAITPEAFGRFAAATTAMMGLGYLALWAAGWPGLGLPRWLAWLLLLPAGLFFVLQGLAVPVLALGAGLILVLLGALLARLGPCDVAGFHVKWPNLIALPAMPVSAWLSYSYFYAYGALLPAEDLIALTALLGLLVWTTGLVLGWRRVGRT